MSYQMERELVSAKASVGSNIDGSICDSKYRSSCRQELKKGCSPKTKYASPRREILRTILSMRESFTVGQLMKKLEAEGLGNYGMVTRLVRLLSENGALEYSFNETKVKVYRVIR